MNGGGIGGLANGIYDGKPKGIGGYLPNEYGRGGGPYIRGGPPPHPY